MTIRADAFNEYDYGSSPTVNGECPHPLLHLNTNHTKCIVPARIDVARHYMMSGGPGGKKETYDTLIARANFF